MTVNKIKILILTQQIKMFSLTFYLFRILFWTFFRHIYVLNKVRMKWQVRIKAFNLNFPKYYQKAPIKHFVSFLWRALYYK